ncbi:MAG: hypothetical protein ACFCVA_16540, partial [Gammaproteobacteria bacterium]
PIAALGGARSSPIYLICLVAALRPPGSRAARDGFFTTSETDLRQSHEQKLWSAVGHSGASHCECRIEFPLNDLVFVRRINSGFKRCP